MGIVWDCLAEEARPFIAAAGRLAAIWHGTAASAVRQIALIQDGHEDRRPLNSHFGAWVICTEHSAPCNVAALDQDDAVLGSIQLSEPPLQW